MKKLLLAIDPEKPSPQSLEFGTYLARLTCSTLTGVFLENLPQARPGVKLAYGSAFVETIDTDAQPEVSFKEKNTEAYIHTFKETCEAKLVNCAVHRDQQVPLDELIRESRYADLLICDAQLFADSPLEEPADFVKSLLAKSECPVVITPYCTHPIKKILFAFDGSASAMFALKQFAYIFPELSGSDLIVLQAQKSAIFDEEEKETLYNYLQPHYNHIDFKDLPGNPRSEIFEYSLRESNALLIIGAYGRTWLSNLFKPSTANLVLQLNNLPVFITHY